MKTSAEGLMEIIGHEGIVQTRYKDSVGVWTVGVGHTASAGPPDPLGLGGKALTLKEVFELFRKDVAKYEARVNKAFTAPLTQHQFDAAVSFDFNTGAIHKATWVKQWNAASRAEAVKSIMSWSKPPEIIPRRKAEQKLFDKGVYSGGGAATVYPANNAGAVQWGKGKRVDLRAALVGAWAAPAPSPAAEPLPPPAAPPTPKELPMPNTALNAAKDMLLPAILNALEKDDTPVAGQNVIQVAVAVNKEIAPILVNATNSEPWWQSRIYLSSIFGLIGVLYTAGLDFLDGTPPPVEVLTGYVTAALGFAGVLYGRAVGASKKPLGQ